MFQVKILPFISNCHKTAKILSSSVHTTSLNFSDIKIEKTVNHVTLLGRAGNDPQKRGTADHPVVIFSLATHNNYKYDSGDMVQRTDWHRISIFKPGLRETVEQYLKKGQRIYVTGRLTYGELKTEDGDVRSTASVIADDVVFLQSKNHDSSQ